MNESHTGGNTNASQQRDMDPFLARQAEFVRQCMERYESHSLLLIASEASEVKVRG